LTYSSLFGGFHLQLTGTALFANDKMVGAIGGQQTIVFLAMMNQLKDANLIIRPNFERLNLKSSKAVLIKKATPRMNLAFNRRQPVIKIQSKMMVMLKEFKWHSVPNATAQKKLERELSEALSKLCSKTIKYTQQIGGDPLGSGDRLRAKHYQYWKTAHWPEDYRKADIRCTVRITISSFGSIY
jgi:hypothetical protein